MLWIGVEICIIVVGLFTQLFFFGIFLLAAIIFHRRVKKLPTRQSQQLLKPASLDWRKLLYALHGASSFILVRSVFEALNMSMGTMDSSRDMKYSCTVLTGY